MSVEVLLQKHLLTLVTEFVLVSVLALINEMVIQARDLNDLLTLPTSHQHGALSPVMNIYRILVEILVISVTEVTNLLIFFLISWWAHVSLMGKARRLLISLCGKILVLSIIGGLKLGSLPEVVIISMD